MSDEIPAVSETEQAAILAEPTPGGIVAWRAEDKARASYPNTTGFETVIPKDYFDGADLPAEKRTAAVVNLRNMFADTGMAPVDAEAIINRVGIVRNDAKTPEQARRDARVQLARTFGEDGADRALNDAKAMIQRDPRFAKWIGKNGLGNDSQTIIQLARAANSQRVRGRLK